MAKTSRSKRRDAGRPRGQHVTDTILEATLAELATSGLEGLSVERVAREAEVNKTTIYRRWPTRAALVAAALEGIAEDIGSHLPDTGSLRGDLLGLLGRVVELLSHPHGRAAARAALSAPAEPAIAALAARRLAQPATGAMAHLVHRARERGEWRDGLAGEQVINTLVGAIVHRALLEHADLTPSWLAATVDLVLLGVVPRDAA